MATDNFKVTSITKPEDYQLVYHSNQHGHIWLDAKQANPFNSNTHWTY